MATITPKLEKLKTLMESEIQKRKALLNEGEELDYDELEEELVGTVIKAMHSPSEEEMNHPAIKQEEVPEPEPEPEAPVEVPADDEAQHRAVDAPTDDAPAAETGVEAPIAVEDEGDGVPVPFAALPPDQQSKPAPPRKAIEEAAKRLKALKETITATDSEYMPRKAKLLEQLQELRQEMREARHKATKDFADIYEACAKRYGVQMDETSDWKSKVNSHLTKAKLLK